MTECILYGHQKIGFAKYLQSGSTQGETPKTEPLALPLRPRTLVKHLVIPSTARDLQRRLSRAIEHCRSRDDPRRWKF